MTFVIDYDQLTTTLHISFNRSSGRYTRNQVTGTSKDIGGLLGELGPLTMTL